MLTFQLNAMVRCKAPASVFAANHRQHALIPPKKSMADQNSAESLEADYEWAPGPEPVVSGIP
jgi:hypothetical protein